MSEPQSNGVTASEDRTGRWQDRLREFFIWAASCSLLFVCANAWMAFTHTENRPVATRDFNDTVKESLAIRLESSRGLFQLGLLLAGALWALYLGKTAETQVDLTQTPELVLFLICNSCFVLSFCSHYAYTGRVSDWINSGVVVETKMGATTENRLEIPDIDEVRLTNLLTWQEGFFYLGCAVALITFICGRYLREPMHENKPNSG